MALYNPILGIIPQPKEDNEEIPLKGLPKSNYTAKVTTPLITEPFILTLEKTQSVAGTSSDTQYNTNEAVLTFISIQGFLSRAAPNSTDGIIDISLNGETIASYNINLPDGGYYPVILQTPINNWRIPPNSTFKLTLTRGGTGGNLTMNASFIGYYSTKI